MRSLFGFLLVLMLFAVIIPTDSATVRCIFCCARMGKRCADNKPACTVELCGRSWHIAMEEECMKNIGEHDTSTIITRCEEQPSSQKSPAVNSKPMVLVTALLPLIAYGSRYML